MILTILYFLGSVIYYHLPWSIRFPIHQKAPQLNRALSLSGFRVMKGWDALALFGKDAKAEVDGAARGDGVYGGYPKQKGFKLIGRIKQLKNRGYVVGYSDSKKNPLWVSYRVFDVPELKSGKRPSGFKMDPRTKANVRHGDYTHSGYDRGHMAPNYAIATRYGVEAQRETFKMSNIIPQKPWINRGMWKDLEMTVAKRYGRYFSEVWIITGPVFTDPIEKLDSGVPIPSHYYKIIADEKEGELRVLAFLIESDCPPYTRIRKRLVSVDQLETLTGLDFFPDLPEETQIQLETDPAGRLWPWIRPMLRYHVRGKTN
ncbi:MAG: DNA/RNA non-specific endonuclease [Pontiella sp.]